MFSDGLLADGAKGLPSMRWIDADGDGRITAADPAYAQLQVWQDANGNGQVDTGEAKSLASLGITSLDYTLGSYEANGQVREMSSPNLEADSVGSRARVLADGSGILIQSSNGQVSLLVTRVDDLSNVQPNEDHATTLEDTETDILASDLDRKSVV